MTEALEAVAGRRGWIISDGKAGNGAIADTTNAAQKAKLTSIAATAKTGLASSDLATVQKAAKETADAVAAAK